MRRMLLSLALVTAVTTSWVPMATGVASAPLPVVSTACPRAGLLLPAADAVVSAPRRGGGVILAFSHFLGDSPVTVEELDSACEPVPSFGIGGIVTLPFRGNGTLIGNVLTGRNGGLILVGSLGSRGLAARLTAAGQLDHTFNGNGFTTLRTEGVDAVAERPDHSLVLGEETDASGCCTLTSIAELTAGGAINTAFGNQGVTRIGYLGEDSTIVALHLLPGGRIMVEGAAGNMGCYATPLTTLTSVGKVQAAFQANVDAGLASALPVGSRFAGSVIERAGGFLVAGTFQTGCIEPGTKARGAIIAFHDDGTLDTRFGQRGRLSFATPFTVDGTEVCLEKKATLLLLQSFEGTEAPLLERLSPGNQPMGLQRIPGSTARSIVEGLICNGAQAFTLENSLLGDGAVHLVPVSH